MKRKDKKLRQVDRTVFTQDNFIKMLKELEKCNAFMQKFIKLPFWKRILFGKYIMKKFLTGTK